MLTDTQKYTTVPLKCSQMNSRPIQHNFHCADTIMPMGHRLLPMGESCIPGNSLRDKAILVSLSQAKPPLLHWAYWDLHRDFASAGQSRPDRWFKARKGVRILVELPLLITSPISPLLHPPISSPSLLCSTRCQPHSSTSEFLWLSLSPG